MILIRKFKGPVLLCICMMALSDCLLYQKTWGLNAAFVFLFLLVGLSPLYYSQDMKKRSWLICLFIINISLFIDVNALNLSLMFLSIVLIFVNFHKKRFSDCFLLPAGSFKAFAFRSIYKFFHDMKLLIRFFSSHNSYINVLKVSFFNWLGAIALSSVFLFLFYLANPLIESWVDAVYINLISVTNDFSSMGFIKRSLFLCLVAILTWGLLRVRLRKNVLDLDISYAGHLSPSFSFKCLICFNLTFLVETLTDINFFFFGGRLPEEFTLAGYAHRGAYPLIVVTILSGVLICLFYKKEGSCEVRKKFLALVLIWVGQNLLLCLFTFQRLFLYVDSYHLTRWRIATFVWLFIIVIGFLLILVKIQKNKNNEWFFRSNVLALVFVLCLCSFLKFDAYIAYYNMTHSKEVANKFVGLDFEYLESLGVSSVPALSVLEQKELKVSNQASLIKSRILKKNNALHKAWYEKTFFEMWVYKYFL